MAQQSMCDIIPHGMEVSPTRPWNGRASTKCLAFQLNKSGIRTGSLRTKLSVARKRNFQSRTKGPKRLRRVKDDQTLRCREAEFSKQRQRGRNGFVGGSSDYLLRRPNPALRARLAVHRDRLSNVSTWIDRKRPTLAALPVDVKAWTCPASTRSNRVSSNRSLRCGETEFSGPRQRGRNGLGDSRTPAQRQISLGNRRGAEAACATDIAC
jgi:hypothetical protein